MSRQISNLLSASIRKFIKDQEDVRQPLGSLDFGIKCSNVLQAGAVISAALITGILSDLPGQITAQVTENIYDSSTGRILLVPQGSRLIGKYDNGVGFGQRRVLLVWSRLIMPNGRSFSNATRAPTVKATPD